VLPLRKDLLLTPNDRSLTGAFDAKEQPVVRQWDVIDHVGEFFGVCGELIRLDGAAAQRFGFVALADGRVVYADAVTPLKAPAPARPRLTRPPNRRRPRRPRDFTACRSAC
jgi:hypothetical protein